MNAADVLIVGAGVVGCAVARELARGGARVVVLERGEPGAEATHAAAGMLSPQAEAAGPGPFLDLLRAARARFPALAAALRDETGIDVGYDAHGTLVLGFDAEDERLLDARFAWQSAAGLPVERLDADAAHALEPRLAPGVRVALRFPEDQQVGNRRLARALARSAVQAGAELRTGVEVAALERAGGSGPLALRLADGAVLRGERVVVAAGCWSGQLRGLPRALPVEPVHGQLTAVHADPPPFRHVLHSPRGYLVPRADGRVIVGATSERTGFRKRVRLAGLLRLLQAAVECCPELGDAPVLDSWAGLRPGTPDELPILGADPAEPRLDYATGHYRNGILLAPLSGELIARLILTGQAPAELEPFGVGRF